MMEEKENKMKRKSLTLAAALVVAGTFGCRTVTADKMDRSNIIPRVGIGPSHITASPDTMFTEEGLKQWEKTRESIDFFKINYKHMDPTKHNQKYPRPKLTPELLVSAMKSMPNISIGAENSEMYYVLDQKELGKAMAKQMFDAFKPLTDIGGRIDSLHMDGAFRIMIGGIYNHDPRPKYQAMTKAFKRLSVEEAYEQMIIFTKEIKRVWPHCKVGWTANLPNWRYSKEFDYSDHGGYFYKMGKVYYEDLLDGYVQALKKEGMNLDFLEVDYPHKWYMKNERNGAKFRDLQAWCSRNKVTYHHVVNTPPKGGAAGFYKGTLEYVEQLHKDGIYPDLMLIQSWYGQPSTHVPEDKEYTTSYITLRAAQKIKELYGKKGGK